MNPVAPGTSFDALSPPQPAAAATTKQVTPRAGAGKPARSVGGKSR